MSQINWLVSICEEHWSFRRCGVLTVNIDPALLVHIQIFSEEVVWQSSVKKIVLKHFAKFFENSCVEVPFLIKLQTGGGLQRYSKESLLQVFSSEFCDIYKESFFVENH